MYKNILTNYKWKQYFAWGFFLIAFLQTFISFLSIAFTEPLFDYVINMRAANRWIHGLNPYQYPFGIDTNNIPFNYPPIGILFFSLFSQIPIKLSGIIFAILSTMAYIFSFILLNSIVKPKLKTNQLIIMLGFLILTFAFKLTLVLGQVNNFVLLFIISSFILYTKDKKNYSAILLAIAGLKMYPLGLLLIFMLKKDFKYVFSTIIIFLIINLLIPDLFIIYFTKVLPYLFNSIPETNYWNQSILSLYIRITDNILISKILFYFTFFSILSGVIFIALKRPLIYSYFTLLALLSITGQFSWQHHLVFSFPFILLYFKRKVILFIIFVFFAIHFHFLSADSIFFKFPLILSYQTITLLFLLYYAIYKEIKLGQIFLKFKRSL